MSTVEEKWNYIVLLDEELLKGGVILSEYVSELIRNADISFAYGAYWASIITVVAAIEAYFISETDCKNKKLYEFINESDLDNKDTELLHNLRRYRNQIVHIKDPWNDEPILSSYDKFSINEEKIAKDAIRLLRTVVYSNPWV
ncbi:MAG TPA: hypothetical protein PKN87_09130 [Syntrophomonadaceae bacterium]|nr:hypothetical protein [Syntrophomonadaceae bacterium]